MNVVQRLQQIYSPGEALAVYRLVMEIRFHLSMTDILLGKDKYLSPNDLTDLENIVSRLLNGEPVQYVLGEAEFRGMRLHVKPGVLIPRPETAELVDAVVEEIPVGCHILDVGTGSGCIAIALAEAGYKVTATDVSPKALRVARHNANVRKAKVHFLLDDIFSPHLPQKQWDAIVSNPPYVCRSEAKEMDLIVRDHEPHEALFVPDDNPLCFYHAILQLATSSLAPTGKIFFEINRRYGNELCALANCMGFSHATCRQDIFGNHRFVICSR